MALSEERLEQIDRVVEGIGVALMVGFGAFLLALPIAVLFAMGQR